MDLQIEAPLPKKLDYRIGILGSGFVVNECHLPAYRKAGFNPAAIASRDRRKAEQTAQRFGIAKVHDSYEDLLDDPSIEVLDIAVPPQAQLDLIRGACARKTVKGILAQKPLGVNFLEAAEAVKACANAGIILSVNQNMRYDPSVRAAKTLLQNGVLGAPVFATIEMRGIPHWQPWQAELGWATLRILSIHHLDCFRYWFGAPAGINCSFRSDPRAAFPHMDGICTYILEYRSGLRCVGIDDPWTGPAREGCPSDIYLRWRIEGMDGLAIGDIGWCRDPFTTPSTIKYASKGDPGFHEPKWTQSWFPDAFIGTMAQLLIALETGTAPAITAGDNLKTMALVDAAYLSAAKNSFVCSGDFQAPPQFAAVKEEPAPVLFPSRDPLAPGFNFSARARQALILAKAEAERLHQGFVSPEHVLIGIIKVGNGPAFGVLTTLDLTLDKVREEVEKEAGRGVEQKASGDIPYAPRTGKMLALAGAEAATAHRVLVGTEHILLALLNEGDGAVPIVLKNLGVDVEKAHAEFREALRHVTAQADKRSGAPGFFKKLFSKPAPAPAPAQPDPKLAIARNFTPRAQQALALARKVASGFNHDFVGTEHLLLGLIALNSGVAVSVLQKLGLNLEAVRKEVEKQVGIGPEHKIIGNISYTPRVKKVLALAAREARNLQHTYVGTEHILLGLLSEGDGVAARVFKSLDVNIEETRAEILRELDPNFAGQEIVQPTPRARQVLKLAREEAGRLKHPSIGPADILVGLIAAGQGIAFDALRLDLAAMRAEAEKQSPAAAEPAAPGKMDYAAESKAVLTEALAEARALNHSFIGSEHILLGLLRAEDGAVKLILKALGADPAAIRAEVLKEIERIFGK
ncbi:MAG TPA: Clp protease N-terminal domain-containing protein [Verrucomicrobiae bacterium]|jgi:hypothetical protein